MQQKGLDSAESQLRKLEIDLLDTTVRRDPETLSLLLAEEFCEFGSSGRIYTRRETIDALQTESAVRFSVSDFSVTMVAADVALVKYQAAGHSESGQMGSTTLRSSLWVLRDNRWQMLFHQGTKVGA